MRVFISKPLLLVCFCLTLMGCVAIEADERDFSFLAFGDAGYTGEGSTLANVATAMRRFCQKQEQQEEGGKTQGCDFALVAGDNIYPKGADGDGNRTADLARFKAVFTDPFGDYHQQFSSDFRFYMALGNHDWYNSRAGAFAQIAFHEQTPPFYMNGPFYSVQPGAGGGAIEVFVLDTEMLLAPMMVDRVTIAADGAVRRSGGKKPGGWKDALPKTPAEKNQLAWFKTSLAQSTASWKIVLAHHPLWESKGSKFAQAEALRDMLMPTLCAHADAWFAGHQHTLEVHEVGCPAPGEAFTPQGAELTQKSLLHVVSGAASKARPIDPGFSRWQESTYPQLHPLFVVGSTQGYVHASVSVERMHLQVLGAPAASRSPNALTTLFEHEFNNPGAGK